MDEEVDRYKRLLGEWNQATPSPRQTPMPQAGSQAPPRPLAEGPGGRPVGRSHEAEAPRARTVAPQPPQGEDRFSSGSILCVNDEELVIYRRPVAGKPLDMVYSLLADGAVKIDAVDLADARVEEIGQLPPGCLKTLQAEMRWTRKLLAPHCFVPEDAERIPDPDASAPAPNPYGAPSDNGAPKVGRTEVPQAAFDKAIQQESAVRIEEEPQQATGKFKIRRGQKLQIKMGYNNWEAVYWGRDAKGSVVAHSTHNHWALMHLDLARYKDSLVVTPEPDMLLVEQIALDLSTQQREAHK